MNKPLILAKIILLSILWMGISSTIWSATYLTEDILYLNNTANGSRFEFDGTDTIEAKSGIILNSTGAVKFTNFDVGLNFTTATLYIKTVFDFTNLYSNRSQGDDMTLGNGDGIYYSDYRDTSSPNSFTDNPDPALTSNLLIPENGLYHVFFTYIVKQDAGLASHNIVQVEVVNLSGGNTVIYSFTSDASHNKNNASSSHVETISFIQNFTENTKLTYRMNNFPSGLTSVKVEPASFGAYYLGTADN